MLDEDEDTSTTTIESKMINTREAFSLTATHLSSFTNEEASPPTRFFNPISLDILFLLFCNSCSSVTVARFFASIERINSEQGLEPLRFIS